MEKNFHHDTFYGAQRLCRKEGQPKMLCSKLHGNNNRLTGTNPEPIISAVQGTMVISLATSPAYFQTSYVANRQKVPVNKEVTNKIQTNSAYPAMRPMLHK